MWIFIIYAFLGWCTEVIIAKCQTGKFVNKGFLNSPFCPIYGFVIAAVLVWLAPIRGNILATFIGSVLLVTSIELLTGYVLEKFFNQKWWDYSKERFNIKGYICLKTSLIWGIACVFAIYVMQPLIDKPVLWLSGNVGAIIAASIILAMIIDMIITIFSLLKSKQKTQYKPKSN